MFNIKELLLSDAFMGNQTELAKFLGIDRIVLGRAKMDVECVNYCVIYDGVTYQFFSKSRLKR